MDIFVPPYQHDHAEILEINFCTVVFGGWLIILAEVYRYLTVLYLQRIILSYQSHTGLGVVERELEIRGLKPFILLLEKKIEKEWSKALTDSNIWMISFSNFNYRQNRL